MDPRQQACRKASALLRLYGNALPELLGEPDEKSFGSADVAEPIRVLVLNHFADELRARSRVVGKPENKLLLVQRSRSGPIPSVGCAFQITD